MENIMLLVVAGSGLFVYYDASKRKIGKIPDRKGLFNLSAGGWAAATMLLWIVAFPAYLIKRGKLIEEAVAKPQVSNSRGLKLGLGAGLFIMTFFLSLGGGIFEGATLPLHDEQATVAAVEKVSAEMFKIVSKRPATQPGGKRKPREIRDILADAFAQAGYSYSATVHKMAREGINVMSSQSQVAGVILLPILSAEGARPEDAHSGQELEDIKAVMRMMGMQ